MKTVCKFTCTEVSQHKGWSNEHPILHSAKLSPVMDGSPENKEFFAATPAGFFEVSTTRNQPFDIGQSYLITIEKAKD